MEDSFIIKNLLKQERGPRLDILPGLDFDSIGKIITSFINGQGGDLILGFEADNKLGYTNFADRDCKKIERFLINNVQPTAPIFVRLISYENQNVILISVWEGATKPYYFNKTIYIRQGVQTISSSSLATTKLLSEQRLFEERWERQPVLGATLKDIDMDEVNITLEKYRKYSPKEFIINSQSFLERKGLYINGHFTNACIVLFGKNPTRFIPQSQIKFVVHPGITAKDTFIKNELFTQNIFKNIDEIRKQFDSIFINRSQIEGYKREERNGYPKIALREGLLNAIVHRDYSVTKSFLTIAIYSNRLTISNYGGLPEELTVNDLKTEHNSILRNPDIAQMCFYRGLIEMLGTGTNRMIRNCITEGFKAPTWKNEKNILEVTYFGISHQYKEPGKGVNEGVNKGVELMFKGVNEGISEGVKAELKRLYSFIEDNPGKNTSYLSIWLEKSISSTERYLKILKDDQLVEFKGAPKTGGYYIKQ